MPGVSLYVPTDFTKRDFANSLLDVFGNTLRTALDPDSLANLADAGSLENWGLKAGSGFGLTQGTSGNRPTVKTCLDGKTNVVQFDGTDDHLELRSGANYTTGWLTKTGIYFAALIFPTATPGAAATFRLFSAKSNSAATSRFSVAIDENNKLITGVRVNNPDSFSTHTTTAGLTLWKWNLVQVSYDTATGALVQRIDTTEETSTEGLVGATWKGSDFDEVHIGANSSGDRFTGFMSHVIVADRATTSAERDFVAAEIRKRFPITKTVIMAGDSIQQMEPSEFDAYQENERLAYQLERLVPPTTQLINLSLSGRGLTAGFIATQWIAAAPTEIDDEVPVPYCQEVILISNAGINDIFNSRSASQVTADISTFASNVKAKIVDSVYWSKFIAHRTASSNNSIIDMNATLDGGLSNVDGIVDLTTVTGYDSTLVGTFTVDTGANELVFSSAHGRSTGDRVHLKSTGTLPAGTSVGGTATDSGSSNTGYFARATSSTRLSLHSTSANATSDTSRANITGSGTGTHSCYYNPNPFNATYYLRTDSPYSPDGTHPTPLGIASFATQWAAVL